MFINISCLIYESQLQISLKYIMNKAMLELQKKVLNGVSNDKGLFKKELIKSLAWLNSFELKELKKWLMAKFYDVHRDIINEVLPPELDFA